jgi:hypothetical protein
LVKEDPIAMSINGAAQRLVTSLPSTSTNTPAQPVESEKIPSWERLVGQALRLSVGACLLPVILLVAALTGIADLAWRCARGIETLAAHGQTLVTSPRAAVPAWQPRPMARARAAAWSVSPHHESHLMN